MQKGKLRIGLIGVGGIARGQHLPGWAKIPFAEVVAAADMSPDALSRASSLIPQAHMCPRWQDLVADPSLDAVDVCTPNRTHFEIVHAALSAGKHVLCEKPLATSSQEIVILQEAAAASQRVLMTAQHFRFDPAAQQLKGLIDAGRLGEVYYTRAQWLRRRLLPGALTFIDRNLSGGGPVFDIGVHVLDLALWFLGFPEPLTVSAFVERKLAHRSDLGSSWGDWDRARFDVEDFAAGLVRFAHGNVLQLEVSWLGFQPEKELTRIQMYGTQAGAIWPDGIVSGETSRAPWDLQLTEMTGEPPHHAEIAAFATAIRDGLPSPVPVEQTHTVIRILEAFYRSGQERREVAVE